jgi:hypothetical protein
MEKDKEVVGQMSKWNVKMSYMMSPGSTIEISLEVEAEDAVSAVEIAKAKESGIWSDYRLMFSVASPA